MDTLTHGLLGYGFAHLRRPTGDTQTDKAVIVGSVIASELPDIDVLLMPGGPLNHIKYHRGFTHSFAGALLLSGLITLVLGRLFPRARKSTLFGWTLASMIFTHLFADWITGFGTMMAVPFSDHRFALDWVALYEPMMLLPFLLAFLLVLRRPEIRRTAMTLALGGAVAWVAGRGLAHEIVTYRVMQEYAAVTPVESVTVHPTLYSLTGWEYVVKSPGAYYLGHRDLLTGRQHEYAAYHRTDLDGDPVLAHARADSAVKTVLGFTRNPLVTYQPDGEGYRLIVSDFRGGYAFNFHLKLNGAYQTTSVKRDYDIRYQTIGQNVAALPVLGAAD